MHISQRVVSTSLCLTLVTLPAVVDAMEIRQFDKLAGDDQIKFVDQLAQSVQDASHGELAARVKYSNRNIVEKTSLAWGASN